MVVVANANIDDFLIGDHVLAHSEPYPQFQLFLSVRLSVYGFVRAKKAVQP